MRPKGVIESERAFICRTRMDKFRRCSILHIVNKSELIVRIG